MEAKQEQTLRSALEVLHQVEQDHRNEQASHVENKELRLARREGKMIERSEDAIRSITALLHFKVV